MYQDQTKEAILQRMLDASPADLDKREGSVTHDLLSPAAIETALAYIALDNVLDFGFADTTYGQYLDSRAADMGLTRNAAVAASGSVTFNGPVGTVIPAGTQVSTGGVSPVYFATQEDVTVESGTATVVVQAVVGGTNGNVGPGAVKVTVGNLAGIIAVTNMQAFSGGVDQETDSQLLSRYYDRVRHPGTSGNANDYKAWAKSIAGVGDAKVYPVWNGNGTVKVVLLDADMTAPDVGLVNSVSTYIESICPIGATVTVVGATEVQIDITATLTLASGATLADAQVQIQEGVASYLKSLAFVDPVVRYSQIASIILNANAVLDYTGLTVNGGAANVNIADGSVAVVGAVNVS